MSFEKLVTTPFIESEPPKFAYTTCDPFKTEFCIPFKALDEILFIRHYFEIKKVIFNNPATIVYWKDGTKTVVKCGKDDVYDEEKGLALCFMKKALNNKGNYNNTFKKYIKENKDGKDNDNKSK